MPDASCRADVIHPKYEQRKSFAQSVSGPFFSIFTGIDANRSSALVCLIVVLILLMLGRPRSAVTRDPQRAASDFEKIDWWPRSSGLFLDQLGFALTDAQLDYRQMPRARHGQRYTRYKIANRRHRPDTRRE